MSAIINQLHDIENNEVFPMTASGAVLTGQNRTLNDDLGNIDSRLSALEGNIKQWEYHAGNVEVADDGQWRLNTIYTEPSTIFRSWAICALRRSALIRYRNSSLSTGFVI